MTIFFSNHLKDSLAMKVTNRLHQFNNEELIGSFAAGVEDQPERLEFFATVKGVQYINDSGSLNVNATWYALETMKSETIWIVGGIDKGNDYEKLYSIVSHKVKAIICLGTDNQAIISAFTSKVKTIVSVASMRAAVKYAEYFSNKGDCVLLSPCCASFDLFENFEDRANQFKKCVREL